MSNTHSDEQTAHELAMMALAISVLNSEDLEHSSDCAVIVDQLAQEYHRNFDNLYQCALRSLEGR